MKETEDSKLTLRFDSAESTHITTKTGIEMWPVPGVPQTQKRQPYRTTLTTNPKPLDSKSKAKPTTVIKLTREITISKPISTTNQQALAFGAICEVTNQQPNQLTAGAKTYVGKCAAEIVAVYAGDDIVGDIIRRATNYRRNYPGAVLTPSALVKHWAMSDNSNTQRSTSSRLLAQAEEEEKWQR